MVDCDGWDQAMVRSLCVVKTDALGVVNYHKGATLSIGRVLWGCMKVQTVVEHAFTGRKFDWYTETGGTFLHFCSLCLESRIFCQCLFLSLFRFGGEAAILVAAGNHVHTAVLHSGIIESKPAAKDSWCREGPAVEILMKSEVTIVPWWFRDNVIMPQTHLRRLQ